MILCFSVHQLTNLADKHKKSQRKSENLLQSRNPMKSPKIRNTRIKEAQRCLLNNQCLFRHVCNRDCAKQKVHDIIWNKTMFNYERKGVKMIFFFFVLLKGKHEELGQWTLLHYMENFGNFFNNSNLFSRLR